MSAGYETWQHEISMGELRKIGDRIKQARTERPAGKLSQDGLADALSENPETKASRITIGMWERGKVTPPLDMIYAISHVTSVDPLWMITGKTDSDIRAELVDVPHMKIQPDNSLESVGTVTLSRVILPAIPDDTMPNLRAFAYANGNCAHGTIDMLIVDETDKAPTGVASLYAYAMAPGQMAMARTKMVAPKDGRERIHVSNTDLMIDDILFVDETTIFGKVLRWGGH